MTLGEDLHMVEPRNHRKNRWHFHFVSRLLKNWKDNFFTNLVNNFIIRLVTFYGL